MLSDTLGTVETALTCLSLTHHTLTHGITQIESALHIMEREWDGITLKLDETEESSVSIFNLAVCDAVFETTEDHLIEIQAMKSSVSVKDFRDRIESVETNATNIHKSLDAILVLRVEGHSVSS